MYTCYQKDVAVLECGQFLSSLLSAYWIIFPGSFGNKRMPLLTRVYGTVHAWFKGRCAYIFNELQPVCLFLAFDDPSTCTVPLPVEESTVS